MGLYGAHPVARSPAVGVLQVARKAYFLRASFVCVLLPLVGLALFFGYLDEWRGYYEAYPIALCLIADSLIRIRLALEDNTVDIPMTNGGED